MAAPLNSTHPCFPVRDAVSNGLLQGDEPINFALPLLIIQITIVLVVTRFMAFLLKPFRQPRVLAEVIGGVLLGPSGLGRSKSYLKAIFPKNSLTLIDTVATLGLLFFLFMVGLELDLKEIRRSGRKAFTIALCGIALPFIGGIGVANLIRESLSLHTNFAPLVVFMGVPLSITAFPVLVRIMAERKLLTTELAKIVVPAAAMNDVFAWILLAIGVAISGSSTSPATPAYVLLCGLIFVLFMLFVVRRYMEWIASRVNGQETVSEIYVCITMMGVLLSGFTTDAIGIHPLFGSFVFGLVVPKEGRFAQMLTEKIEDFVTVLMLPLFFASSGLKTNLGSINTAKSFGFLFLLTAIASIGKISATVAIALYLKLKLNEAFAFGFLMNTKGLVELIVLNIGKDIGVFDDQIFAILVLMCLTLMFFTTPAVVALYKPARASVPYINRKLEGSNGKKEQLRILACVHGPRSIPPLLNLVEAFRGTSKKNMPPKLYAMHLIELSNRTSSIMTLSRARGKLEDGDAGKQASANNIQEDNILVAFEAYRQISNIPVKLLTAVSELSNMHYDVCNEAAEKRATVILLPYMELYQKADGSIEHVNSGFRAVNQRVMQYAPCTVGILVDKGLWGSELNLSESTTSAQRVAVFFFGGADDREALAFGKRLSEHPNIILHVVRFVKAHPDHVLCIGNGATAWEDNRSDEETLASVLKPKAEQNGKGMVRESSVDYEEACYEEGKATETAVGMAKGKEFGLIVVGRGGEGSSGELGMVGEALANAGAEVKSALLVIQQHQSSAAAENAMKHAAVVASAEQKIQPSPSP